MFFIPQPFRGAVEGAYRLTGSKPENITDIKKVDILRKDIFPTVTQGLVALGISALLSSRLGNSPLKQGSITVLAGCLSLPATLIAWGGRLLVEGIKQLPVAGKLATSKALAHSLGRIGAGFLVLELTRWGKEKPPSQDFNWSDLRHWGILQPFIGPYQDASNGAYLCNIPSLLGSLIG